MSGDAARRKGIKWPVCTLLILLALGSVGYWGYAKFRAGQAARIESPARAQAPAKAGAPLKDPPPAAYRSRLPFYFLVAFSVVMA
ncbi:MAG: hypothetical protein V3V62_12535, partial [bacterium]